MAPWPPPKYAPDNTGRVLTKGVFDSNKINEMSIPYDIFSDRLGLPSTLRKFSDITFKYIWDFRDVLRRKSLRFFLGKITNSATRSQKRYNFKTAKGRNFKFRN